MQPTLMLADAFALSAGTGGAMMATTDKKCPTGYYYNPSTYNCWPKPGTSMYSGGTTMLRDDVLDEFFITVPQEDGSLVAVREDVFDGLDPATWNRVMDILEPYNSPGTSGIFSKWRERRAQRREDRHANKLETITARAQGRAGVAAAGGGWQNILGGLFQGVTGAIGGGGGGADQRGLDIQYSTGQTALQKPMWQRPEVIIPAILLIGGGIYLATRKKK